MFQRPSLRVHKKKVTKKTNKTTEGTGKLQQQQKNSNNYYFSITGKYKDGVSERKWQIGKLNGGERKRKRRENSGTMKQGNRFPFNVDEWIRKGKTSKIIIFPKI